MKNKYLIRYAVYGALFGFVFPVLSTIIRLVGSSLPLTIENIRFIQQNDFLLWVIDTAPIFLGLFAAIGGYHQDRIVESNQNYITSNLKLAEITNDLQVSTNQVKAILDSLVEGIGVVDQDGKFTMVSESLVQLFNFNGSSDLLGMNVLDLVSEDIENTVNINVFDSSFRRIPHEYVFRKNDNDLFIGEMVSKRLNDQEDKHIGTVIAIRDITTQKNVAKALEESEERLKLILNSLPVSIMIARMPDGKILFVNQTLEREFKGVIEDIFYPQKTSNKYFTPAERSDLVNKYLDQGYLRNIELQGNWRMDGNSVWVELSMQPFVYNDQESALITLIDISERKRAEEILEYRMNFENLASEISSRFVNLPTSLMDSAISDSLKAIGEFTKVERIFICELNHPENSLYITQQWCTEGLYQYPQVLVEYPIDITSWLVPQLKHKELVHIPKVDELPDVVRFPNGAEELQSALYLPLKIKDNLYGFVGFETFSQPYDWETESINLLKTIAATYSGILDRHYTEKQIQVSLERRSSQVQVSTRIAQEISTSVSLDELYRNVVQLIKERFGYYHAQILQFNPEINEMVLTVGYGETGQAMLDQGHSMAMGVGIIGYAALEGKSVLRPDLKDDPNWQQNPLLPETKGEIAVPIKYKETVFGVLDVQSTEAGQLTQDDQILLEGLCGQIAIAIEDNRLRTDMNNRINELENLYQNTANQAWREYSESASYASYLFDKKSVINISQFGQENKINSVNDDKYISLPIYLKGDYKIGELAIENIPNFPLSEEELSFIEQLTEQAAAALESARLFNQTQNALAETDTLYNIISDLNSSQDYETILSVLTERTILRQADQSLIMFLFDRPLQENETPEWVFPIAKKVLSSIEISDRYPLSAFESEPNTLFTKTTVVLEDVLNDVRLDRLTTTFFKTVFSAKSSIIIPLLIGERSIGFIMGNFSQPREFKNHDIRRLSSIASQVAIAVQSLQFLGQTEARAKREELLRKITNQINSAVGVDAILRRAAEQVGRALDRPAYVYLNSQEEAAVFDGG